MSAYSILCHCWVVMSNGNSGIIDTLFTTTDGYLFNPSASCCYDMTVVVMIAAVMFLSTIQELSFLIQLSLKYALSTLSNKIKNVCVCFRENRWNSLSQDSNLGHAMMSCFLERYL